MTSVCAGTATNQVDLPGPLTTSLTSLGIPQSAVGMKGFADSAGSCRYMCTLQWCAGKVQHFVHCLIVHYLI
jgi:hypothetical protein